MKWKMTPNRLSDLGECRMKRGQTMKIAFLGAAFAAILCVRSGHAEPPDYIMSDCHQGDCAKYYLVKTFPSPPSTYPPFSTDQYLAHVKAIGYCNPGVQDCAKGEYVDGDQGTYISYIRCSTPGYIRGAPVTSSIEEPNAHPNHATLVSDAIWKRVCGR
jgi:hypothetical protein